MHALIRFLLLLNTAVWVGSGVFFTFLAGPAPFSAEVASFLPRPYAERFAEVMIHRYFILYLICSIVAIVMVVAEYLESGRLPGAPLLASLVLLVCIGCCSLWWLEPKMNALHRVKYSVSATPDQKEVAQAEFRRYHGISQVSNLVGLLLLGGYLWSVSRPPYNPRQMAYVKPSRGVS